MKRTILYLLILVSALFLLTSCLPTEAITPEDSPAGFLLGIWHGWLAPLSLIVSLFRPEVRIYQAFNTGWWYDFGYYIAVISGFGGLSLFRKNKEKSSKS